MAARWRLVLTAMLAIAFGRPASAAPPDVVASIVPIHSLAAALMEGVGEPKLLLRGGASPHGYAMRPSDAAALQEADLVFWVGPQMEGFLERPLEALSDEIARVALIDAPGLALLSTREGGVWEPEEYDEHEHEHGSGEIDGHVWLDPANAAAMVRRMADALAAADPAHAQRYAANTASLVDRLTALTNELETEFAPVKGRPFIVFHDAYHYLEHAFGLNAAGSITVSPDRPPSAKRLAELRRAIVDRGAVCVFGEPRTPTDLVAAIAEDAGAGTAELDAEGGSAVTPGPDAYFELMRGLSRSITTCLDRAS